MPDADTLFERQTIMQKTDVLVIGAGQAGIPLAKRLAKAGYNTTLIEKREVGGTCINDGCTPTKTLIGHAEVAHIVKNSSRWGIHVSGDITINYPEIKAHKDQIVNSFRGSAIRGIESTEGLDLVMGEAFFTGPQSIEVLLPSGECVAYTAPLIFINGGCSTVVPDIPGLKETSYYTSTTLLETESIPKHLVIIGGSYIALELGQLFHRLGSRVTILEKAASVIPQEDNDVAACLTEILQSQGITIHTGTQVKQTENTSNGEVLIHYLQHGTERKITGTHLLIATGRKPQTEKLQLQKAGIAVDDKGYVIVDKYLETNVKGVYALGDIKGGPAFTHVAYNDYVVLLKNIVEKQNWSIEGRLVPYCMFTDPQLGRVGLSERQARQRGIPIVTYTLSMDRVARALETNHLEGMMKAVVHKETDLILGAAIIGDQGGEIMTVMQMAIQAGLTCDAIRWGMFAHPLYAESLNNLFMQPAK